MGHFFSILGVAMACSFASISAMGFATREARRLVLVPVKSTVGRSK